MSGVVIRADNDNGGRPNVAKVDSHLCMTGLTRFGNQWVLGITKIVDTPDGAVPMIELLAALPDPRFDWESHYQRYPMSRPGCSGKIHGYQQGKPTAYDRALRQQRADHLKVIK